jgi:hypothetical protein
MAALQETDATFARVVDTASPVAGFASLPRRPALVGLALLTTLVGSFAVVRAAEKVWAADIHRNLDAAREILNGSFGTVPDYLYSPLAAALTVPALALPTDVAVITWLLFKLALLATGVAIATRGLEGTERFLLGVTAIGFLPVVYDLELGNVTVLVLASVALVAWTPDRIVTGIPLGLILATAPKPQLFPVLVWLLLVHRRALAGALLTGAIATLVGLIVVGTAAYATWIDVLRAPAYLNSGEVINLALWPLPTLIAIPAAIVAAATFALALARGDRPGLVAALCAGLLLAPYTLLYAAGLLLTVFPAAARAAPRATFALGLIAPPALVLAFPIWIGTVLVFSVLVPSSAWPPSPGDSRSASPIQQR